MTKRVALVTGGVGELGRAICERLASQGCRVVAMDISIENGAGEWLARMRAHGHDLTLVEGDVTSFDACAATVGEVERLVGPVDILVNCAGITRDARLANMEPDMWNEVLTTNLDSVFNITRQVVDGMTQRGFGRIINISSLNGEKGQFGQTNYSAAKAGMHGFTMALAQEVARKGVTVNTVSPGYMETRMVRAVPEHIREQILEQIPLGRFGRTSEIGAVVGFLASEDASYVTGANFSVNGGHHMH
ncbi:MAG: acetoacetyl-CoA reductase [Gammaproteobacteria bacterium]|nr:acetoacetyl-CoA reductase [Gammaproteobacteria bacterium]NIM73184.1 acetoacetyl-CoA reductase [Gammaproteobacteria bacterium]NIN40020.1 acetoacetyl-CoA reductase [Gammaproteobacteria bacterium]NIO26234.1 acetoacetyl-CoA reductase [Gammaproteobacteria bacterium]NIO66043.1 acetoacetyl-CoA reductase [Gammaproteobacteria bacterium]